MEWSNPTGNLFQFDCNKRNAVSLHCQDLLQNTNQNPIDFFDLFIEKDILEMIVVNTNLYANQYITERIVTEEITPGSRLNAWYDTTEDEIRLFLALLIWMGLDKKPSLKDYWSKNTLYSNEISKYMSRNRFGLLLKFIHFADNEQCPPGSRLHKIEHLLAVINDKFMKMYEPGESITID